MTNKTLSINPALFSISSSKTKKNRSKRERGKTQTPIPIVSPNVLKNKLLKRIKEHKQRETSNLDSNKKKLQPKIEEISPLKNREIHADNSINNDILGFNDEFNDSIQYLQSLSKKRSTDSEKAKYEALKQKRKQELERKTIKNYHLGEYSATPMIQVDLPDELQEVSIQTTFKEEPYKINTPDKKDNVPYGVLKGGLKPTYREWTKTQRSDIVTNPNSSLIIHGGGIQTEKSARENRLNLLKQKIKQKNQISVETPKLESSEKMIRPPNVNNSLLPSEITINTTLPQPQIQPQLQSQSQSQSQINQTQISVGPNEKIIATKHITKKTIKRKYMLGRSRTKNTVGILIKDKGTRKKVLVAQKDLKRKNINDIKAYLREHNLIKTGSNAPNDVIRKLYESAMLAGEVTNSSSDILLHNFTKEDKQL